jgi:hypothetical protein
LADTARLMEMRPMPVTPIHGYREPSDTALKFVNDNKIAAATLLRAIERLVADARWVEIARMHFEQGYMALNRSILQPDRVEVPD